jgi:hypothetical protein
MAEFLDWGDIKQDQVDELEKRLEVDELKRYIKTVFGISYGDEKRDEFATNFHLFNYA